MAKQGRKLTEEEERQAFGGCYKAAFKYAADHKKEGAILIHGSMTPPHGVWTSIKGERAYNIQIDHAWVEIGNNVFDASHNTDPIAMRKDKYYKTLNVNEKNLRKYSADEALINFFKNHSYGPWD